MLNANDHLNVGYTFTLNSGVTHISGGALTARSLAGDAGTLAFAFGSLSIGADLHVGDNAPLSSLAVHANDYVSVGGTLTVGTGGSVDVSGGNLSAHGLNIYGGTVMLATPQYLGALSIAKSPTVGTLQIELASTNNFGKPVVAGQLTLSGTLGVLLVDGFMPVVGDSFDIFDWGSRSGTFSSVLLPPLASGLKWETSQLYTTGAISVAVGIHGDYDQNGLADAPDYVLWRKYLGTTYTQSDYDIWRVHFGQTAGSGSAVAENISVPEPTIPVMLLMGVLALGSSRRAKVS